MTKRTLDIAENVLRVGLSLIDLIKAVKKKPEKEEDNADG